ncbi:MAG: type II toxin-antitoxin system RelE/ParE family toxin [Planctomycetes bacterium]|nr:type II toxin-antitoxin system RelE/ParE family toxin [Planctomycetota bacterium]
MLSVRYEAEAKGDIVDAHEWFDDRRPGLGSAFERATEAAINWIVENTSACREIRPGVRKYRVRGFPYAIYFKVTETEIIVFAVVHGARYPGIVDLRLPPESG